MDIAYASIGYRGYAEDEVSATLDLGRKTGFILMEVHGPLTWNAEAIASCARPDRVH